jgi:hypothetical protein
MSESNKQIKAYYQENKEKIAERQKAYRQAMKEEIAKRKKAWYQENKEEITERQKAYRQENKEKISEYYRGNKEEIAEYKKAWYQENKEEIAERRKAYRQENKEEIAEYRHLNKFIIKTKTCSKCKQTKDIGEFSKDKKRKDGLRTQCKSCASEHSKAYHQKNKEAIAEKNKAYRQENKEELAEYRKAYHQKNKEAIAEKNKAYHQKNKEAIAKRKKKYKQKRYNNDPIFKLTQLYRNSLKRAFKSIVKKKNYDSLKTLGLEKWQEFADRLSKQFYDHPITGEKMTFENHGKGEGCWQIDHKIPLLTAKTEEDVIRLSHYTNLQPLWTIDHKKKTVSDINSN